MSTAQARGWGPGWPADRRPDMVNVSAGGVTVPVNRGIAGLVEYALGQAQAFGYQLVPGWCWGYANRAIRGTSTPSNHSWGLAVDLNAPHNPQSRTLVTDIPAGYVDLWRSLGFRWGGDYAGTKDAMHFEYMGTVAEAAASMAKVMGAAVAAAPPPAPPGPSSSSLGPAYPGTPIREGSRGNQVRTWQARMRDRGWAIDVDGIYGPASANVARRFQAEKHLTIDGVVGPATWAAAWSAPVTR